METLLPTLNYASFGRRALALILDFFIIAIPASMSHLAFPFGGPLLIWFFYSPILEASPYRATLGKYWVGIQVVDLNGRTISLKSAYLRYFAKSLLESLFVFGYLFALFTARRQALHDLIAETTVVYGRREEGSLWDAWVDGMRNLFSNLGTSPQDHDTAGEELSGAGTGFAGPVATAAASPNAEPSPSALDQLERLQKLKENGALTEDEFQEQKRKILSRL